MPNEAKNADAAFGIGNLAFYRMCDEFDAHDNEHYVQDKLIFISRVYSVSRGLGGKWKELSRSICENGKELDKIISNCKMTDFPENLKLVVECHGYLDDLVCNILKSAKIDAHGRASFSSKYLHFYAPDAFPILDTLASSGLQQLTPGFRTSLDEPRPYECFCERLAHYFNISGLKMVSLRDIDTKLVELGRRKRQEAAKASAPTPPPAAPQHSEG